MNYISLINRFWVIDLERSVSPNDTRLWFYLVHTCNSLGWKEPFGQSDRHLAVKLLMSVNTVREGKNRLKQMGLLDFQAPKNGSKGHEGQTKYWLNTRTVSTGDTVSDTVSDTVPDTVPADTNNKLNKRKQRDDLSPPVQRTLNFETNLIFDVESELSKNKILLEKICMAARKPMPVALVSLRRYHLHLEENEKYPVSRKGSFAGFEKWLMNERIQQSDLHIETNGTIKNATEEASKRVLDQFE